MLLGGVAKSREFYSLSLEAAENSEATSSRDNTLFHTYSESVNGRMVETPSGLPDIENLAVLPSKSALITSVSWLSAQWA